MAERTSGRKKRVINDDEMKDMLFELVDSCSQAGMLRGKFSGEEIREWLKRRFAIHDAAKELGLIKDDPATEATRGPLAPRPQSPEEKAELQKRVDSLVNKWAVQHAERLKAAKRRRTLSK